MTVHQVRWGVIGAGDVVEHKSGPALMGVPGSSITAVMRRDAARAEDFARRHGIPRWYADADAVIDDPDVDAVYVATPPDTHAAYAIRAAEAGKPVYVEKPVARTVAECEAMITACESASVGLYVAYYRRALPRFVAAADAVRAGRIGEVRAASIRLLRTSAGEGWRVDPIVSGGGLFVDLGAHVLDWLDHVLGPVAEVHGDASGGPAESVVAASMRHEGGALVTGLWDFAAAEDLDVIELIGTAGTIRMSTFGTDAPVLTTAGPTGATTSELTSVDPPAVQYGLVDNVVRAIRGEAEPLSTGRSALRTTRVIDAVLAGHRARHGLTFRVT